jgi:hypothetical protein
MRRAIAVHSRGDWPQETALNTITLAYVTSKSHHLKFSLWDRRQSRRGHRDRASRGDADNLPHEPQRRWDESIAHLARLVQERRVTWVKGASPSSTARPVRQGECGSVVESRSR